MVDTNTSKVAFEFLDINKDGLITDAELEIAMAFLE
jgi:Ca2+-binding EF-hand superfamily protein